MDPQYFTGNPLERSLDVLQKFDGSSVPSGSAEVALVVVAGRQVCVRISADSALGPGTAVPTEQDLQALLLGITDPQLDLNSEHISFGFLEGGGAMHALHACRMLHAMGIGAGLLFTLPRLHAVTAELDAPCSTSSSTLQRPTAESVEDCNGHDSGTSYGPQESGSLSVAEPPGYPPNLSERRLPLYLLGRDRDERWTFAIDVSGCKQAFMRFLKSTCKLDVQMGDLRTLMPTLSKVSCAFPPRNTVFVSAPHPTRHFI